MVRAEPRAASRLAAHGPRDSHKVDPRDFSQLNSPDAYKDGSATYVGCAQQGQYPTFARCAMSLRGDVRSRGVVPAERSSAEFSASHIFSAARALRWAMRERPELCIRIHRGGNANLPRAVRTIRQSPYCRLSRGRRCADDGSDKIGALASGGRAQTHT